MPNKVYAIQLKWRIRPLEFLILASILFYPVSGRGKREFEGIIFSNKKPTVTKPGHSEDD